MNTECWTKGRPEYILSPSNRTLSHVRKLRRKHVRDEEGLLVLEGANLLEEAIRHHIPLTDVLIAEDASTERLGPLLSEYVPTNRMKLLPRDLFEQAAEAVNGSGFLAIAEKPQMTKNKLREELRAGDNILVLDRVQDPGNIGTMVRTAVAAGYRAVITMKGTADCYSSKVLRATAGMIFAIPLLTLEGPEELSAYTGELGKQLTVTDPAGGIPYYSCDLTRDIALVIGNEGKGVDPAIMDAAEKRVTIPMSGEIESLNAAVAAALLMYEAHRIPAEL